jgi:hypothetical protein
MNKARKESEEKLLAEAAAILGLAPDQVLFETGPGYGPANKDRNRRAAALAELRAAVFLKEQGFSAIRLVPPSDRPTADILAARGKRTYAFEVQCVTRASSFSAPGGAKAPGAVLAVKFCAKLKQAKAFRKRNALDGLGVILVLASGGGDAAALARAAHECAGSPAGAHACVLAEGAAGIWPPWGD